MIHIFLYSVKYYCIWHSMSKHYIALAMIWFLKSNPVCLFFLEQSFLLHTSCRVCPLDWCWEVSWSTIGGEQKKEEFSPSPASTQVRVCEFVPKNLIWCRICVFVCFGSISFSKLFLFHFKDPTGWQRLMLGKEGRTLATIIEPTNR